MQTGSNGGRAHASVCAGPIQLPIKPTRNDRIERIMKKSQLTLEQASLLLRALLVLAVVLSTVAAALLSLYLQSLAPSGSGVSYAIFHYNQEVVGVSLVGAILPLLVACLAIVAISFLTWPVSLPTSELGRSFWFSVLLVGLLSVAAFTVSHALYGGLTLPSTWSEASVFVGAGGGVAYAWYRGRRHSLVLATLECYAIGTLGVLLSDAIRTFGGLVSVTDGAAVWGGGGLLDFVFWFGIYLALGCGIFGGLSRWFAWVTKTSWTLRVKSSMDPSIVGQ